MSATRKETTATPINSESKKPETPMTPVTADELKQVEGGKGHHVVFDNSGTIGGRSSYGNTIV